MFYETPCIIKFIGTHHSFMIFIKVGEMCIIWTLLYFVHCIYLRLQKQIYKEVTFLIFDVFFNHQNKSSMNIYPKALELTWSSSTFSDKFDAL